MFEDNGLSERELEILRLVATGASNKEIAVQLVISPNTVKVHLRNIFSKIDVVSRTEATLYAIRIGLVKADVLDMQDVSEFTTATVSVVGDVPKPEPRPRWRTPLILGLALVVIVVMVLSIRPLLFPETPATLPVTISESRWVAFADMPAARSSMAGTVYEGVVYLIGGQTDGSVTGSVLAYDAINDRWEEKNSKPTAVSAANAVVIGEKIYVPGGMIADDTATNVLEIYNPRSDVWETGPSMPVALGGYAIASYEGNLFLFGGWDGTNYSSAVFTYDPAQENWVERSGMETPRAFGSAAVLGSKIYLAGGINDRGVLGDTQVYYPDRLDQGENSWEKRASLPEKRYGGSMAALAGGLYLAGGMDESGNTSLPPLKFDEAKDEWEQLELSQMSIGGQLSLLAVDTRIHIFGGEIEDQTLMGHTAYQAIYTVLIPAITR